MPASRQVTRINTLEMKSEMEGKLGRSKAEFYFCLLTKFLSLKISKLDFNELCVGTIGKENLHLHNKLVRSIVKNATLSVMAPPKPSEESGSLSVVVPNGYHKDGLNSLCRDFLQSPRKGRTPSFRDRRFKDRPSPLGPQGKSHCVPCEDSTLTRVQEQHSASELFSLGSRPPCSDEDSEEVEQGTRSLGLYRKIPLVAPLGVLEGIRMRQKLVAKQPPDFAAPSDTCQRNGLLPGTSSLMKRLKMKMDAEGLSMSEDCANVFVSGLDVYMKSLMKPCLELAASRYGNNRGNGQVVPGLNGGAWPVRYAERTSAQATASVLDFRVAVDTNPTLLGEDWPRKLEKICYYESQDRSGS